MPPPVPAPHPSAAADRPCPVCGAAGAPLFRTRGIDRALAPEDFRVTDSRYGVTLTLFRCGTCRFIFAAGSEIQELVSLYERLEDPEYEITQQSRRLQMRWIVAASRLAHPGATSLLDIGAGAGLLAAEAAAAGLRAEGVEPSRSLVEAASRLHGIALHQGLYPHPATAGRRFDLVTLVDVIEHVADPVALLRQAAGALAHGGRMIVVTPDAASLAARMLRRRWWHYRLAHVGYFDLSNLTRAAERAGLVRVDAFRARWFFPVSYLAERMERYAPIGRLNRFCERVPPLRWLRRRIVPLNLFDSWVVVLALRDPPPDAAEGRVR
ncbi:MAG: class I SAM-dependent methyltransferase [Phycisphaerales bacterium]|nr:class I SAM-dependent methyltransferase [Phycisphaerales bacterium]